jgi:hypothetical protein
MPCSVVISEWRPASDASLALASLTGNRSTPPQKGVHGDDKPKNVNGRKRPILGDTLGWLLAVTVTAASVQGCDGAMQLLDGVWHTFSRLRLIWVDQPYGGDLVAWPWSLRPWRNIRLAIVKRPEGSKGFLLLPQRWIVEMCQSPCCCTSFAADDLGPS